MSYQDKHTMWHNKPCINGEPSSNNGWIYSAYARYLAPESVNHIERFYVYKDCIKSIFPLKIDRLPNKETPPMSKDEIIGLISAGLVTRHEIESSHYNFCNFEDYQPKKLTFKSVFKAAKILWSIRKEHRNYVWENNLRDAYCLAFYLPPQDQYYVRRFHGQGTSLTQTLAFYLNAVNVFLRGDKSSRMILWLQLKDMDHFLSKYVPEKRWISDYFEKDHPFRLTVN